MLQESLLQSRLLKLPLCLADPDLFHVGVDLFVMMDMLQPMAFLKLLQAKIQLSEASIGILSMGMVFLCKPLQPQQSHVQLFGRVFGCRFGHALCGSQLLQ